MYNIKDLNEVAIIVAVIAAHFLDKGATIEQYEKVRELGKKFNNEYGHVRDWPEFIEEEKSQAADWEDFLVMWAKPQL